MDTMHLIVYVAMVVFMLSTVSLSQSETPVVHSPNTTVTTTTSSFVPSQPHNHSHATSEEDSQETENDADHDVDDDATDGGDDDDDDDDGHETYPNPLKNPTDDGYDTYPNPRRNPTGCHVGTEPSWLCDQNGILDKKTAKELNELLESLVDAKGICPCQSASCSYTGFPMAVVVLETIPAYINKSEEGKEEYVQYLAQRFLNDWDFNTCNDGAVTIVVNNERIVETVIGHASEYLVPDDCQESIENDTFSLFEAGHIEAGLTKMIEQYRSIVDKTHACNNDAHLKKSIIIPIILIIALIIVAAVVAAVVVIYRRRGSKDLRTEANVPLKDEQHTEKA